MKGVEHGQQNPKTELSLPRELIWNCISAIFRVSPLGFVFSPGPPEGALRAKVPQSLLSVHCSTWTCVSPVHVWRLLKSVIAHLAACHLGLHRYCNLSPQVPVERKKKKRKPYRKIVKLCGILPPQKDERIGIDRILSGRNFIFKRECSVWWSSNFLAAAVRCWHTYPAHSKWAGGRVAPSKQNALFKARLSRCRFY